MRSPSFVVVAGMHRSGTSMVGGILSSLGVDMGRRLVPADERNARGYFEDADVVELHGRMFRALLPAGAPGHVDWGWCEGQVLDSAALGQFTDEARGIVGSPSPRCGPRGFKDPRATLVLDFWDNCLPDARYVLVYRFPWEVADSVHRLGAPVFLRNPSYGYRIWAHYNERLLAFRAEHPERCLLVSSNAIHRDYPAFRSLLEAHLGLLPVAGEPARGVDEDLLTISSPDDRRCDLTGAAFPECLDLLKRLDEAADLPARGLWRSRHSQRTTVRHPGSPGEIEVTVVVPVHDEGALLLEAVASLEAAASDTTEAVIVDDGSTDAETLRILGCLEERGYLVVHQPNGGLSSARNTGIRHGRGRFVLPLDADNRLRTGFLELATRVLQETPDVGIVYGDRQLFGRMQGRIEVPDFDLERMRGGNYIDACALYRRELWEDLGGYDTRMTGLEDWEFWLHAASRGWRFHHVPEVALDYRIRPGSLLTASLAHGVRRRLFRHVLSKHAALFDQGVPRGFRLMSAMVARVAGRARAAPLERLERRLFWTSLWSLVGPGGHLVGDRARQSRPSPQRMDR